MPTWTALTTLDNPASAEALGEAMEGLVPEPTGIGVFEMEDGSGLWEVGGYFTDDPDAAGLALLAKIHGAKDFVVSQLPEVDWVAHVKRELSPVEAGRFFVYGSHDADRLPSGRIGLLIEASMAFGTGHHGTTLGCLKALDRLANRGVVARNVIDVGCGTAVLAMAAAKIWPNPTMASDIDEVACDVARANIAANQMEDSVHVVEAAGFDHPDIAAAQPFDLVFANILKGPLIGLAPDMSRMISKGGRAILSGILNPQADEVVGVYQANGFSVDHREVNGDWTTLTMLRG
ncbi:50S ribosomal protein L11 methyltransferase [Maritimibacter sp. DP1N21-5]|uniref:50S ribosomal protein L11 methyltransferase n=1 Tax=Maritimibacter sp. DP1N21-5 TaxID=2836867 RepID=UPI001C48385A|nr:50S ribosomal protein L11 methyltransferase [Maritimibacter sp. DP1N21-5]MBV7410797.1 50S ribosomal protein L11 methyltransferase [Maritimibacter sp. DP1N21-5]